MSVAGAAEEQAREVGVDQRQYDVIVAGASFAGLSFASVAAARGLRTLVLERDPVVGGVVRTTGILFSDVFDVMEVPQRYLVNAVRTAAGARDWRRDSGGD